MLTVTFRADRAFDRFLAPARRGQAVVRRCAETTTLKHAIEALGIPHTEVGQALVNGEPAALDQRLHDGDEVTVSPIAPGRPTTNGEPHGSSPIPRFIADSHLGGLARLLRMAGFDTLYDNHYHDKVIQDISGSEGRVVLTRDRELLKRRAIEHGQYVHALQPEEQLREVAGRFGLAAAARPFTLCLNCNVPLRQVDKMRVRDRVPHMAWHRHEHFTTCDTCLRVFWAGTHWQRMRTALAQALAEPD